jgi:hypothetical protein
MDYQIEMIFCHTGSQAMDTYALRPIDELLGQVNEGDTTELLVFVESKHKKSTKSSKNQISLLFHNKYTTLQTICQ